MMSSEEIEKVCRAADMIVCGYAFTRVADGNTRVLNLNEPHHALVMSPQGEVLETSMDDVELAVVGEYWRKNRKYMEGAHA